MRKFFLLRGVSSLTHLSRRSSLGATKLALSTRFLTTLFLTSLWLAPQSALAGFSVEISVDGGVPLVYLDNGPEDLDPGIYDIEIPFTVGDLGNNWSASGTVLATGGNGSPPVSTIVTDTLIENIGGQFLQGQIVVVHNYTASGLGTHIATLDGQFENVLGTDIGYAELRLFAAVNSQSMGMLHEGPVINTPGPQAFDGGMLVLQLPTTTEHIFDFQFYLGDPGDAIRLFNSAELHTLVPEPSSAVLAVLAAGIVGVWRRKRFRAALG